VAPFRALRHQAMATPSAIASAKHKLLAELRPWMIMLG
jgi:hypothetical protein